MSLFSSHCSVDRRCHSGSKPQPGINQATSDLKRLEGHYNFSDDLQLCFLHTFSKITNPRNRRVKCLKKTASCMEEPWEWPGGNAKGGWCRWSKQWTVFLSSQSGPAGSASGMHSARRTAQWTLLSQHVNQKEQQAGCSRRCFDSSHASLSDGTPVQQGWWELLEGPKKKNGR